MASVEEVEPLWRELERRAEPSFFLSWIWVRTWLELTRLKPLVVAVRTGAGVVGLGLLSPRTRRRFGLSWPALSLNETGLAEFDSIMVEDNGFLAERGLESMVASAGLMAIGQSKHDWRELRLSGVRDTGTSVAELLGLPVRVEARRTSYSVETAAVASDGQLTSLSANTRRQINRSLRLYAERGVVVLDASPDLDTAMARFAELETLHQRYWRSRGKPGAFAEPFFGRFHRTLLQRGFPTGLVDVLRVTAGGQTIGLLHTFFYGQDAYAYQSGFQFEDDPRLKPGLVSHLLAIRHCRDVGLRSYRLLAGDSRYKRSLATSQYELYWLSVSRPHLAFRLERLARWIARREP